MGRDTIAGGGSGGSHTVRPSTGALASVDEWGIGPDRLYCIHYQPRFGPAPRCNRDQCLRQRRFVDALIEAVRGWPGSAGADLRRNMIVLDAIAED